MIPLIVEDITKSNLKEITNLELYELKLRFEGVHRSLHRGYLEFEKKEPLIKINWDNFFKRYKWLMEEFKTRRLRCHRGSVDLDLEKSEKKFNLEILGSYAQLNSPLGEHFSLLIRYKDKRILIDPAVHKKEIKEELDLIIVTQADKDHWEYLKEYKDIPVYTVGAIFDRLPKSEDTHLFLKPLKIDGLEIIPIKTTPVVGTPSIGLRLDVGKKKISILPEFLELGKAQKDLVKGSIWICGVGDYEKDDKERGKLPFLSLLQLAEELKPRAIYLTNLRKDILKNKEKVNTGLKIWNGKILYDGDILEEQDLEKREGWGLNKPAYRIFTFEDLKNTPHFQEGKAVVEAKFDGMRTKIIKKGEDITIMSDPEDIKGSPIKTKRLPWQVEELKKMKEDFEGDSEIIMIDKEKNECLHRTTTNALLNGKFDPAEDSKKAHVVIFDNLEYAGKKIEDWPLKERKELLSKFKDTEHIHFVESSTNLEKDSLSYIVDLGDLKQVEKAKDKIMGYAHKGGPYPKHIAEGVMIKLLNAPYETPQSHSMVKWKEKYEIDALVAGKKEIIREGKKTGNWNYELAVGPIDKEWAEAISRKDKKAVTEFKGKFYNHIGKSDNTKEDVVIGSILRVASEDVNSYETDDPKYLYYKAYVSVVLQPVPEKNVPDKMFVLERLSGFTPRRERLVEKAVKDDVKTSIAEGKIPKEIYKEHAKENGPLPKEFYNDYREGEAFIQTHIRGLEPEEVEEYKKGKITLAELFEGHSIHLDDRMSFSGLKRLVQWVITDNNVESYLRMLKGELVETASGVKNVAKSFALVKPSAEEPGKVKKIEEIKEPSISKKGAKILADLQIVKGSYFIAPGEVGSTAYRYAWMGLIWRGKVKSGIGRKDYHEYFYYPGENLPEKNKELVKGRYVVKAFKRPKGAGNYWQVWKATEGFPADPIEHRDSGYYVLVPAKDLKAIGRERYRYGRKEPV